MLSPGSHTLDNCVSLVFIHGCLCDVDCKQFMGLKLLCIIDHLEITYNFVLFPINRLPVINTSLSSY